MDEEATLRCDYSKVDAGLQDRPGLDKSNWEHLHAYDQWMDRIYWRQESLDLILDPDLPLPAHRRALVETVRAEHDGRRRRATPTIPRIRSARPGQRAPARR